MTKGWYTQSRMDSSAEAFCKKPFRPCFPMPLAGNIRDLSGCLSRSRVTDVTEVGVFEIRSDRRI